MSNLSTEGGLLLQEDRGLEEGADSERVVEGAHPLPGLRQGF